MATQSGAGGADPGASSRYRDQLSLPEFLLWQQLRLRPFGLKFRKQHPLGRLRLDFYCAERRLAIEVDGEAHNRGDRPQRDLRRDAWLRGQGLTVLRVPARDVLRDAGRAADAIARYALALPRAFYAPELRRRAGPSDPLRGPPPQQAGEERSCLDPPQLVGEVAARGADGGAFPRSRSS